MTLPSPGKPFGPYAVDHPVGQGGFGAVYRARDTRLGRTVALKVMRDAEDPDPENVARFLREARLAAALEHPNIVRIHDVGTFEGTPYIVMEWVDGTTLGRAKVERPAELLATIAETLAFAHERGIVHRDLKPANVMVDREGRPKLVDFGIAKRIAIGPAPTFATREGIVLGTPQYMAPEQELTSAVDARADQWAWGAIAYELLTGERPTRPALAHAALDERLGAVILRALAIAPSERFASMRDLHAAWKDASSPAPEAKPEPKKPASRAMLFVATTASVTLIACLGLALAMSAKKPAPAPAPPASTPLPVALVPAPVDDAASEPPVDAAAADAEADGSTRKARSGPPPGMFVVRSLGPLVIDGSSYVDHEQLLPQLRRERPAFERCVTGLTLPAAVADVPIVAYVTFFANGEKNGVRWVESAMGGGLARGGEGFAVDWPPFAARPCLETQIRKLKVVPTRENADAFCRLRIDPKR